MTGPVAWPPTPIHTGRPALRAAEARDRAAVIELPASPEVGAYLGGPRPRQDLEVAVAEVPGSRPGFFVVEVAGAAVGVVTFDRRQSSRSDHRRPEANEVELGYMFLPEAWGYGCALEAGTATLDWLVSVLPGEPVVLSTQTANQRSIRLAARLGCVEVDRFEEHDTEQFFTARQATPPTCCAWARGGLRRLISRWSTSYAGPISDRRRRRRSVPAPGHQGRRAGADRDRDVGLARDLRALPARSRCMSSRCRRAHWGNQRAPLADSGSAGEGPFTFIV